MKAIVAVEKSVVRIEVSPRQWPLNGWTFYFSFDAGSEPYARLLTEHINEAFRRRTKRLVQQAYELGWEDAKKRRRKKQNFTECWESEELAW